MELYDTLTKQKRVLTPRSGNKLGVFVCGPTVYDYAHIGHARTYIAFDAFAKYLKHEGFEVRYAQNITDIDDKIIERARKLNEPPEELARNFETEYLHDMEKLGIDSVDKYARATDYIPQIISQVERLIQKKFAYIIDGDGVYFDISKFKSYGKLSGRTVGDAEDAVSRIDESVNKKNKGDFALWKFSPSTSSGQVNLDEPKWLSPWGEGRPGWHIEDTAITEQELGEQYDIHGGARDLIFPHHESEIAQMEAISGKAPLVNFWMHTGFLTVKGEKMSKSLGNFITIHEFLRTYSKETFRLFILSSHYRSPIDYSEVAVKQAEANTKRLGEFYVKIKSARPLPLRSPLNPFGSNGRAGGGSYEYIKKFFTELADDFNTPKAFATLFDLIREGNSRIAENKLNADEADEIIKFLDDINKVFGIIPEIQLPEIPQEVLKLTKKREQLRKEKKWKEADKIRKDVEELGYTIKDTLKGPKIQKA